MSVPRSRATFPRRAAPSGVGTATMVQTLSQSATALRQFPSADDLAGTVSFILIDLLRTDHASPRPDAPARPLGNCALLPLRAVAASDGHSQLIDGFKRLAAWRPHGYTPVPVVVETPCSPAQQKQLLLTANSTPRVSDISRAPRQILPGRIQGLTLFRAADFLMRSCPRDTEARRDRCPEGSRGERG